MCARWWGFSCEHSNPDNNCQLTNTPVHGLRPPIRIGVVTPWPTGISASIQPAVCPTSSYLNPGPERLTMPSPALKLFYKGNKLSTLHTSSTHHTIVSANNLNLCETGNQTAQARLLGTDLQASTVIIPSESQSIIAYSPYGKDNLPAGSLLLSRFAGQYLLPLANDYLLGNGHRLFVTQLMRFTSADVFSPFGKGGLNVYAYCGNDPINRTDPAGQSFTYYLKKLTGGYSYRTLSKRLDSIKPNLSTREYKALNKSVDKRLKRTPEYKPYNDQKKLLDSLELLQVEGKKDRYHIPLASPEPITDTASPITSPRNSHRRDSTISETFSELIARFEALKIKPQPNTTLAQATGNSQTWPKRRPASDNFVNFTGNYIDTTIYNLRTTTI